MQARLHAFLTEDHARLDALLERAVADPATIDREAYAAFRRGLLRHIAIEEKVVIPVTRRLQPDVPLPYAPALRADHSALAALLVPTPTHAILAQIRHVLEHHNPLEEGAGGLYDECERRSGSEIERVLHRMNAIAEVPVAPHVDGPRVAERIASLLRARLDVRR